MIIRTDRPMIKQLIGKKNLVGAEIGVEYGYNAIGILTQLDIKKLYLIDPYWEFPRASGNGVRPTEEMQQIKSEALINLKKYEDKIEWVFDYSWNVADQIEDESLDFVYIDGDHRYEAVYKDIELYFSKVKIGGLIGGHDYIPREKGVIRAVNKFFPKINHKNWDWWTVKK